MFLLKEGYGQNEIAFLSGRQDTLYPLETRHMREE